MQSAAAEATGGRVASVFAGRGDPVRTIELLWADGPPAGRSGPRPRLTTDAIALAAIVLADAEGLDAVSMRRVAERLGVAAMSLYRYVPGKAGLLDLVVDRVCAEVEPVPRRGGWRTRLERVAVANRNLFVRHPWLLDVFPGRPPLGPGVIGKYERELRALAGSGLGDVELDLVLSAVLAYVRGAARSVVESSQLREQTGVDDLAWWARVGPVLERVMDPSAAPVAVRVGRAAAEHYGGAHDAEEVFDFGLQRLLDGVEAMVAAPARSPR
jgi:AcrR family transcriptional regulator